MSYFSLVEGFVGRQVAVYQKDINLQKAGKKIAANMQNAGKSATPPAVTGAGNKLNKTA